MKRAPGTLDAVGRPLLSPLRGRLDRNIDQDRQVRRQPAREVGVQRLHALRVQPPPVPLIGDRGIAVSIEQDDPSRIQGGPYDLRHELRASRQEQSQLGLGRQVLARGSEEELANRFAHLRRPRLAGRDHLVPFGAQEIGQPLDLGRLPATLASLERHQDAAELLASWVASRGALHRPEYRPGGGQTQAVRKG